MRITRQGQWPQGTHVLQLASLDVTLEPDQTFGHQRREYVVHLGINDPDDHRLLGYQGEQIR